MGNKSLGKKEKLIISLYAREEGGFNIITKEKNAQFMDIVKLMGK